MNSYRVRVHWDYDNDWNGWEIAESPGVALDQFLDGIRTVIQLPSDPTSIQYEVQLAPNDDQEEATAPGQQTRAGTS